MVLDISGIYFFMPVFSFLFVFLISYAILAKTNVLGESSFINVLISFIIAVIFMSFSSLELYVTTIIPWTVVLLVCILLVLMVAGLSTKELGKIMTTQFAWVAIAILLVVFLIAAIYVFNPVLHPDLGVAAGGAGESLLGQIRDKMGTGASGTILLLIIAGIVAWILTKKG